MIRKRTPAMTRFTLCTAVRCGNKVGLLKRLHTLYQPAPLAAQVAGFLLKDKREGLIDLGSTMVLIPAAGAARAIRRELAKRGVLSPSFRLPMDALQPPGASVASRLEREAAWVEVLDPKNHGTFAALVPEAVNLENAADRFGVASRLSNACDQLAEAGHTPSSADLRKLLSEDWVRWETFGTIYRKYLQVLAKHSLQDPNEIRLEQATNPEIPPSLERLVVACIPDLPVLVQHYLEALGEKGVAVDVLAWDPSGQAGHLDDWGRPDPVWWKANMPRVSDEMLVVENDPPSEAGILLDEVAKHRELGCDIFAVSPESSVAMAAEISRRSAKAYLPDGKALGQSEPAVILLGWETFRRSTRLRDLRSLLLRPAFLAWFVTDANHEAFTADRALETCDILLARQLCETVGSARSWLKHALEPDTDREASKRAQLDRFVRTAESLLKTRLTHSEFIARVFGESAPISPGSLKARQLTALDESLDQFKESPLLASLEVDWQVVAMQADIGRKRVFAPAEPEAIEIQGWLEVPWSAAALKIVAGCREGSLPSGPAEDAFLPDSARKSLGIANQDTRFARDAYLLSCLLSSPARMLLGASRFRSQGEPNRPSRLLFACDDSDLPERAKRLLKPTLPAKRGEVKAAPWLLELPRPAGGVEYIRVTGFKSYLQCPLRFYLENISGLSDFDPEAGEISPRDFGTVLHKVLEEFGADAKARLMDDARKIADFFDAKLDEVARRYYGAEFTPVVRVQLESMRARLRSLAPLQAETRAEGWEIIATEKAIRKTDERKLAIGPLFLTGTMDRVEVNERQGVLRILDYKTFSKPQTPASTHLAPGRKREDVSSAKCTYQGKQAAWKDLQLPLYRYLVPHIWPGHKDKRVEVGYVLLPADPDETAIEMLPMEKAEWESAIACAEEVAGLVKKGVFWPPAEKADYDKFGDWFRWCEPGEIVSADSIKALGGAA